VPEQGGEQVAGRQRLAGLDPRVGALQRQHDELLAQRLFQDHVEQRQQAVVQAVVAQAVHRLDRMPGEQQLQHFVEQARRRHVLHQLGHFADRRPHRRVEHQAQLGREAHGAQHAHRVFAVALPRVADHAQRLLLQVGDAVVVVDHGFGGRVVIQRIDREVAPRGIFGDGAEDVVAQHAAVFVLDRMGVVRGAEGGDFQRLAALHHMHDLEAAADDAGAAEQGAHLLGRGIGGDVVVLGVDAGDQVAHRAADDIGLVAGLCRVSQVRRAPSET
jgi:hypothetical protein